MKYLYYKIEKDMDCLNEVNWVHRFLPTEWWMYPPPIDKITLFFRREINSSPFDHLYYRLPLKRKETEYIKELYENKQIIDNHWVRTPYYCVLTMGKLHPQTRFPFIQIEEDDIFLELL